jgi:hypothetical protein
MRANRTLPTRRGMTTVSRFEPRLSKAGSLLVFKEPHYVAVRCWSKREWKLVAREYTTYFGETRSDLLGFTQETNANIAPTACAVLAKLVYKKRRPARGKALVLAAVSVGVLAHELQHVYEDVPPGEAETECRGIQKMPRLGLLLGLSYSYARLLTTTYWKYVYPLDPPRYRTPRCRPDGPYDDHPGDGVWP